MTSPPPTSAGSSTASAPSTTSRGSWNGPSPLASRLSSPDLALRSSPLLTARQAAERLGVSADYVRTHGAGLGIAVPLDGVVRYRPVAVEQVRQVRQRRQPPRD